MAFTRVLLPNLPTVDVIAAYAIFQEATGQESPLGINFADRKTVISNNQLQMLQDHGVFPISVGKGQTYKDSKVGGCEFGSETGALIYELRQLGRVLFTDEVVDRFVVMMDRDNKDGYLTKSQPFSVGWIAQQAYRLGYNHEEVVRRTAHVVRIYLNALTERADKKPDLGMYEKAKRTSAMLLLPDGAARTHCGPLTVSRYIRDMFCLGFTEQKMVANVGWFVHVHDVAKRRQAAADKAAKTQNFDKIRLAGQTKVGVWVDSDDPYLMAALRIYDLAVMRSSKGNVIIMSKSFDLSRVAREFFAREPECEFDGMKSEVWYFNSDRNFLANGTESEPTAPTGLSRSEIEQDLSLNVIPRYNQ